MESVRYRTFGSRSTDNPNPPRVYGNKNYPSYVYILGTNTDDVPVVFQLNMETLERIEIFVGSSHYDSFNGSTRIDDDLTGDFIVDREGVVHFHHKDGLTGKSSIKRYRSGGSVISYEIPNVDLITDYRFVGSRLLVVGIDRTGISKIYLIQP